MEAEASSPPAPGSPDPVAAFSNPAEEADFLAARRYLIEPPPSRRKLNLLVISAAAFAGLWLLQGGGSLVDLGILVGVLIVHELGHAIGMRAFGYRDVTVFFIPLFGAAASGRPRGVARSKQAIVLLLGPLPGLVAGCVLAWLDGPRWLHTLAVMLIWVNALNLVPVEPLDGGQLFQVLVFSRQRYLELVFRGATAAVVFGVSLYFHLWVLAAVGYLLIATLSQRARLLRAAAALGRLGWPEDPAVLDEAQQRTLFRAMWDSLPARWHAGWRGKHEAQAARMETLFARATQRPPSALASLGVFGLWLAGLALALAGSVAVARSSSAPPDWHRHDERVAAFSVELPGPVRIESDAERAAHPGYDGMATAVWRKSDYSVVWISVASSTDWLRKMRAQLGDDHKVTDGFEDEYWIRSSTRVLARMKLVAGNNGFGYILSVAPGDDPSARRVFDSFAARANPRF